jgi:subtilase family serine protease
MPANPKALPAARRVACGVGRHLGYVAMFTAAAVTVLALSGPASGVSSVAAPSLGEPLNAAQLAPRHACVSVAPDFASCFAVVDTGLHWSGRSWEPGAAPASRPVAAPPRKPRAAASPAAPQAPQPYMAADLQSAYNLPSATAGTGQVIAVVDAFDDPAAAADLAAYRAANALPACDSAPCFIKVNQQGQQGDYPPSDSGWAVEESLDLDMASAICPNCHIILVEANDNSVANLALAVDEAAALGATVISNSYGASEGPYEAGIAPYYSHKGVAIVASSGDSGYGASVPAAYGTVTAVGGTALYPDPYSARGWSEEDWDFAGSGCSAYVAKPAWQHDPLCPMRMIADVSADADPNTPVAVYDSAAGGWIAVGGTSVGAPIIAGVYALAGNAAQADQGAGYVYAHSEFLNDVTGGPPFYAGDGDNGYCGDTYICTAKPGYDGPTGLGTPDGTGAF